MVKKVGKYEIGRTLGEGTFGKVYLGLNQRTGELFALKQVPLSNETEAETLELEGDVQVVQYQFHAANDRKPRDPTGWKFSIVNPDGSFTVLSTQSGVAPPEGRMVYDGDNFSPTYGTPGHNDCRVGGMDSGDAYYSADGCVDGSKTVVVGAPA